MNVYIPIKHLESAPSLEQVFLIQDAQQRFGKNPFVILTLSDLTGTIKCYIFDQKLNPALEVGKFVLLNTKVEVREESLQLVAKSWQPFNGHPDNLSDYIHCPNPNVIEAYAERLKTFLDSIEDGDYRNIIGNVSSQRMRLFDKLKEYPCGLTGKYAYRGGLLVYTVQLLSLINKAIEAFSEGQHDLNKDLLILGCIFRNLSWWPGTTQKGDLFVASEIHKKLGVRFIAGMLANHACITTESDLKIQIPLEKKLNLQHVAFASENDPNILPEVRLIIASQEMLESANFKI